MMRCIFATVTLWVIMGCLPLSFVVRTFRAEGAFSDLPAMVFKCVCMAAFMDVAFIAFDMPMVRTPRLAVTHQPAVIPVIEGTAVIGPANISGGVGTSLTPALAA